eukprot:3632164-Pleurochrysis_carterae.AAC.1
MNKAGQELASCANAKCARANGNTCPGRDEGEGERVGSDAGAHGLPKHPDAVIQYRSNPAS